MTKRNIKIEDYANDIVKALPKGILLTTKADKVNSMVIGWGHDWYELGQACVRSLCPRGQINKRAAG